MKNLLKKIALTLTLLLSLNTITVFAETNDFNEITSSNNNIDKSEEEQINEREKILKFLIEEAGIYDEQGYLINYDLDLLRKTYGEDPILNELEEIIILNNYYSSKEENTTRSKRSLTPFGECVLSELKNKWGDGVKKAVVTGGIMALIKKASYKEAAKIIAKKLPFVSAVSIAYDLFIISTNKCGDKIDIAPSTNCTNNPIHSQFGCH